MIGCKCGSLNELALQPVKDDLESALYGGKAHPAKDQFHHWHDVARMFYWLAGKKNDFQDFLGTDSWPMGQPPRRQPGDFHTFPL